MLGAVVAVLAIIAAADYLFQYRQWFERQKMSMREIKEEFKQTEGDPHDQGQDPADPPGPHASKRMMAAVPKASVVITNPTHFAVALKYERGMNAPVCVAKGVDAVALKIREVAGEHGVPIVENPPLARALHATVEIDQEIPPEHYQAVAEVIGYVMRLNRAMARAQVTLRDSPAARCARPLARTDRLGHSGHGERGGSRAEHAGHHGGADLEREARPRGGRSHAQRAAAAAASVSCC